MQKYNHIVAVNESSPKNNQTKLNNSQLHLRRKLPQPPSANRKHSPTSFSHASPVAPIKPPHFPALQLLQCYSLLISPRYSCYSVTVPFLFLIQHSAQSWWRVSDTLVCEVYSVTTLHSRWSLSMVLLKGRVSDTHECTSQSVASIRLIKIRHNLSRVSKTRFLGNTTLRNAVW